MPGARENEHIGPGEKTFAFIPMSHRCFSLIKEAMKTADKTYRFDFSFSSNDRLYHESQSHQTEPLAALCLIHLVCVTDKANFRAILPTLLLMDPMGVGSRITSCLLIFVNNISVEIQLMWETETQGHQTTESSLHAHRGMMRYPSCSTLSQISKWGKLHCGWKADTMLP